MTDGFQETQGHLIECIISELLLGLGDELIGVVPVLQQVGGLLVVHADVVVLKNAWEEVVDLPRHIEDVPHTEGVKRRTSLAGTSTPY